MEKKEIENIAYLFNQAKNANPPKPKPIVFIGAGASASAGIPLTGKIIEDILLRYKDRPEIKNLDSEERKNYYKVMGAIGTHERHELLRGYIESENVKINVTHIYLAQLLKEGYVDYVLTVNFDDLLLRACALYNFIPAVYDISILKDFTTTTLQKRSITYLHGQYHGLWLLNTPQELDIVKEPGKDSLNNVFRQICNERTWVIVGYSGEDGILDKIANLGSRFDNDLFWIGYNDSEPIDHVKNKLLNVPNKNAYWVSGYDSDSFFVNLHSELKLETPEIFNKPFSFLSGMVEKIKDIHSEKSANPEHKALYRSIADRFETSKKWIEDSIARYENPDVEKILLNEEEINIDDLKQEIIEATIKENFEHADFFLMNAKRVSPRLDKTIARYYYQWGFFKAKNGFFNDSKNLFKTALEFDNDLFTYYINLADVLYSEGNIDSALDSFEKAHGIKPDDIHLIIEIAQIYDEQKHYEEAITYLKKAIEIAPTSPRAFQLISHIYFKIINHSEAIRNIEIAIKNEPDNHSFKAMLALYYLDSLEFEKAENTINHVLSFDSNPLFKCLKGSILIERGNYEVARDIFDDLLNKNPNYIEAISAKGYLLLVMGNLQEAVKFFDYSLKLNNKPGDFMNLGHVYLCQGNEEKAIECYLNDLKSRENMKRFLWDAEKDFRHLEKLGIDKEYFFRIIEITIDQYMAQISPTRKTKSSRPPSQ